MKNTKDSVPEQLWQRFKAKAKREHPDVDLHHAIFLAGMIGVMMTLKDILDSDLSAEAKGIAFDQFDREIKAEGVKVIMKECFQDDPSNHPHG